MDNGKSSSGEKPARSPGDYPHAPANPVVRHALMALGFLMVGLALIGAVLPVLPTVPFLLVAAWAFSRSSERFHRWIYTHPRLGPPLLAWNRHGVIPRRAKVIAIAGMYGSLLLVILFVARGWLLPVIHATVITAVTVFLLSRPSRIPDQCASD